MRRFFLAIRIALFSAGAALGPTLAAAFEWKTQTLSVTTAPFQTIQAAVFEFKNTGAKPVTIRSIETSCQCLNARADAKTYAPGAVGVIHAEFTVGDRSGLHERTITVITDESEGAVRLMLRVDVPDVATVTPRSLSWRVKETPGEKSVELRAADGLDIDFSDTVVTSDAFSARMEVVEAGKHYRIFLKPRDTTEPAAAAVRIKGREKSGHEVLVSAYVSVL